MPEDPEKCMPEDPEKCMADPPREAKWAPPPPPPPPRRCAHRGGASRITLNVAMDNQRRIATL